MTYARTATSKRTGHRAASVASLRAALITKRRQTETEQQQTERVKRYLAKTYAVYLAD